MNVEHQIPDNLEDLELVMESYLGIINQVLKEAGLKLPEADIPKVEFSEMEVRCYDPALGIHDFDPSRHYGYLEALGAYYPEDKPEQQRITLFIRNLEKVAVVFTINHRGIMKSDARFNDYLDAHFKRILSLVLCHEIAHWIVHNCISKNGKALRKLYYQKNDEIFYHEGLAQALLFAAIKDSDKFFVDNTEDLPSLMDIMIWMENGQPDQYIAYKRLGGNTINTLKAMDVFRHTNIQSFELLEQGAHLFNKNSVPDLQILFERFFKKPFTTNFQTEHFETVKEYMSEHLPEAANKLRGVFTGRKFGI